jgi:hypothetical protein
MHDMDVGVSYLFVYTVTPLLPVKGHGAALLVQLQRPLHEFGDSGRGFEVEFANCGASTGRWSRIGCGDISGNILQSIGASKSGQPEKIYTHHLPAPPRIPPHPCRHHHLSRSVDLDAFLSVRGEAAVPVMQAVADLCMHCHQSTGTKIYTYQTTPHIHQEKISFHNLVVIWFAVLDWANLGKFEQKRPNYLDFLAWLVLTLQLKFIVTPEDQAS